MPFRTGTASYCKQTIDTRARITSDAVSGTSRIPVWLAGYLTRLFVCWLSGCSTSRVARHCTALFIGKRIGSGLLLLAATMLLQSCYYFTQGYYLFNYTYSAKRIDKIIDNANADADTLRFLQKVITIQDYASKLGLESSKKYKTYKELDREYLVAVVQAAEALSVEPYKWRYPFMGKLPYKGYYNSKHAKKEAQRLKAQGLDTMVRKVSAFSTLNILPDPIFSFMKHYSEAELVETLFHEQMHATVWVKKQDAFSEQLATFVGRQAMQLYMQETYGKESEEHRNMEIEAQDSQTFRALLIDTRNQLETLYKDTTLSDEQKLLAKENILLAQQKYLEVHYSELFSTEKYKKARIDKLNNAYFALLTTYESAQNEFIEAYKRCNSDLPKFIAEVKKIDNRKEYRKAPYAFLALLPLTPPLTTNQ